MSVTDERSGMCRLNGREMALKAIRRHRFGRSVTCAAAEDLRRSKPDFILLDACKICSRT